MLTARVPPGGLLDTKEAPGTAVTTWLMLPLVALGSIWPDTVTVAVAPLDRLRLLTSGAPVPVCLPRPSTIV